MNHRVRNDSIGPWTIPVALRLKGDSSTWGNLEVVPEKITMKDFSNVAAGYFLSGGGIR